MIQLMIMKFDNESMIIMTLVNSQKVKVISYFKQSAFRQTIFFFQ